MGIVRPDIPAAPADDKATCAPAERKGSASHAHGPPVTAPKNLAEFHRHYRLAVWKIVGIYAVFGALWIYLSDTILGWIVSDPELLTRISVEKGLLFIILTTALLFTLLTRYFHNYEKALNALEQSEERYRALVEQAPDAITVIDLDENRFVDANPNALRLFGCRRDALLATGPRHYYVTEKEDGSSSGETIQDQWERAFAGELLVFERTIRNAQGQNLYCEVRLARLPDANRRLLRASYVDITERKQLEGKFRQAQKMEAFGQLAGGVAHDFNNLLTVIQSYAALLEKGGLAQTEQREFIREIALAGERATNLTRQLLTFSRRRTMQPADIDLNDVVANLAKMLQRLIGEHITLESSLTSGPAMIHGDAGMMEQILMNLVINARDAMPQGGRLAIKTAARSFTAADSAANAKNRSGDFVQLSVEDSGCGITPEYLPRIFEPFFTTKQVGKGTGLGLATVFGIVEQHGGWIQVESQVGVGTTFHLFLPRLKETAAPAPTPVAQEIPQGTETILVVEDDPSVRNLAKSFLTDQGYRVHEASNGQAALEVWRQHGASIDLLFTDMVMPGGLLGQALAKKLHAEKPRLKVIYCSGFSDEMVSDTYSAENGFFFLQKPYDPERLARVVRDCLDSGH
jgi:PAS domain S-box-containing protein